MTDRSRAVGDMPESALIQRVSRLLGPAPRGMVGIGDDAAVLPPSNTSLVVSNDTLVEGTHFRSGWLTPRELGRKALAVAASDLAAMGARPLAAVVALNLPGSYTVEAFEGLLRGMKAAGKEWDLPVVGGNLARSRELCLTPTVWGRLRGRALLRHGMAPDSWVFVTGVPGWAHLGLKLLSRETAAQAREAVHARFGRIPGARRALRAWTRPTPRFDALEPLRRMQPQAVLDTSDSLAQTLEHLLGGTLDITLREPRFPAAYRGLAAHVRISPHRAWFFGGEDYQLCFAVSPRRGRALAGSGRLGTCPVTCIGTVRTGSGRLLTGSGERLTGADFHHFG